MARTVVSAVDPAQSWAHEVGIDDPLPAFDIFFRVVEHFHARRTGTTVTLELLTTEFRRDMARAIRIQAEMRMMAQDFGVLDRMAHEVSVRHAGQGKYEAGAPDGWLDALDKALHTWACARCGAVVPGVRHGREDCDAELARDVMES